MAHILPDDNWSAVTPAAPAPPWPHGWLCAGCGRSYAPWIPMCHFCPRPASAEGNDPGPIETSSCP